MSAKNIYYVYAYLREKNGTPYYIGMGSKRRAFDKHVRSNKSDIRPRDKSRIVFLEKNLTLVGAIALERRYIRWYGRLDLRTGILLNLTDGGEGGMNFSPAIKKKLSDLGKGRTPWNKGISPTQEVKDKISCANKGRTPWNKGIPHNEEQKEKLKEAWVRKKEKNHQPWNKGIKMSEENRLIAKEKRLEGLRKKFGEDYIPKAWMRERKDKTLVCPFCHKEGGQRNMARYHFNNCKSRAI